MKSKFATIIMTIVILLISSVFVLFGVIFWNEFIEVEEVAQPENVKTIISENTNTINKEIKVPEILENPLDEIKDSELQEETVNYSNITVNKYFYNQLEDYSQIIYNAFESNKENMKTGTYKIEFGNSFSTLLSEENGQEQLGKYYQSAIEAYNYDNPEVFYLSPNKMYLNIEATTQRNKTTYNVYISSKDGENYLTDEFSSKEQINTALQQIEQVKEQILQNKKTNTYENIKMVHDYLIENTEYDTSVSKENIYNIYGAMVNKQAVCEGYAKSFKYLMDALGIPCTLVIGEATNSEGQTENHAWNYVQIDENWYAIDCTWDDPISSTGWVSEASKYRYFLKGSDDMAKNHEPSGQFTEGGKIFTYPTLNTSNYK